MHKLLRSDLKTSKPQQQQQHHQQQQGDELSDEDPTDYGFLTADAHRRAEGLARACSKRSLGFSTSNNDSLSSQNSAASTQANGEIYRRQEWTQQDVGYRISLLWDPSAPCKGIVPPSRIPQQDSSPNPRLQVGQKSTASFPHYSSHSDLKRCCEDPEMLSNHWTNGVIAEAKTVSGRLNQTLSELTDEDEIQALQNRYQKLSLLADSHPNKVFSQPLAANHRFQGFNCSVKSHSDLLLHSPPTTTSATNGLHESSSLVLPELAPSRLSSSTSSVTNELTRGGASLSDKLRLAASEGHDAIVLELLKAGAAFDRDKEGRTALHYAAHHGHLSTVRTLIDHGCPLNVQDNYGFTALHRAVAQGHVEIVQALLDAGCSPNVHDQNGNTPVHLAAWNGFSRSVETLIKIRANISTTNKSGFTALHMACQNGHNQCSRHLLLAGINPDLKNTYGDTALHTAARYKHAGVARILLSGKAKPNVQNKNGDTPLHIAAALRHRKITKILMELGELQVDIKNKQNETAADIAKRKGHVDIIDMINIYKKKQQTAQAAKNPVDDGQRKVLKQRRNKSQTRTRARSKTMTIPSPYSDDLSFAKPAKGMQFYRDLSGKVCQGPSVKATEQETNHLLPYLRSLEQRIERTREELLQRTEHSHRLLDQRIKGAEQRTYRQLDVLKKLVRERLAEAEQRLSQQFEDHDLHQQVQDEQERQSSEERVREDLRHWLDTRMARFERKFGAGMERGYDSAVKDVLDLLDRNGLEVRTGTLARSLRTQLHRTRSEETLSEYQRERLQVTRDSAVAALRQGVKHSTPNQSASAAGNSSESTHLVSSSKSSGDVRPGHIPPTKKLYNSPRNSMLYTTNKTGSSTQNESGSPHYDSMPRLRAHWRSPINSQLADEFERQCLSLPKCTREERLEAYFRRQSLPAGHDQEEEHEEEEEETPAATNPAVPSSLSTGSPLSRSEPSITAERRPQLCLDTDNSTNQSNESGYSTVLGGSGSRPGSARMAPWSPLRNGFTATDRLVSVHNYLYSKGLSNGRDDIPEDDMYEEQPGTDV